MSRRQHLALGISTLALFLSVCSPQNSRSPQLNHLNAAEHLNTDHNGRSSLDSSTTQPNLVPHVEVIATKLKLPWAIAFSDNGRTFITERTRGVVSELIDGKLSEIQKLPIHAKGEGGLLGLAASPQFENHTQLYVYYTTRTDNRVARFQPGKKPEIILTGIPSAATHNGGALAFGPDEMLYISTGDSANARLAQDPSSLAGKILRIHPDGRIPHDNPFTNSPIYALGFRNVQGLAWNQKGELYATEFGPQIDDEINHIKPGKNYGWPEVTGNSGNAKFSNPVVIQQPRDAAWSGATFLHSSKIPAWEDNLFVAALRGKRLWRFVFDDTGKLTDQQSLLHNEYGQIRNVTQAPDGSLWLLTSNEEGQSDPQNEDDRILRVTLTTR